MGEAGFKSLILAATALPSEVTGTLALLGLQLRHSVSASTVTWPSSLRVCAPVSSHDLLIYKVVGFGSPSDPVWPHLS